MDTIADIFVRFSLLADIIVHMPLLWLAGNQLTETIRHGEIFSHLRAWMEAFSNFTAELILCAFCLSHWTVSVLTIYWLSGHFLSAMFQWPSGSFVFWNAPIYGLAAICGSQLLNDLTYTIRRTPGRRFHGVDSGTEQ